MTDARQVLAVFVEQLGREGPRTHPRGIGLDDTEHAVERPGTQARAGAGKARRGVGCGHVRIGPEIHIQHCTLRALEQHVRIGTAQLVQRARHVGHQRCDLLAHRQLRLEGLLEVHRRCAVVLLQHEIMEIEHGAELGGEAVALEQVRDPHRAARHLVLVGGADATPGGADGVGSARALARLVEHDMRGQDERAVR